MNFNIEKEYKILVSKENFYKLLDHYPNITFHTQVNTYFDTIDHKIKKLKGAMRIRQVNGSYIFTLKMFHGDELLEHECEVPNNNVRTIETNKEIQSLLMEYGIEGEFYTLCNLKTERAIYRTDHAELCFDISTYGSITDYEIEYEWMDDHDGLYDFNSILSLIDIQYSKNCHSKIKRAMDHLCN